MSTYNRKGHYRTGPNGKRVWVSAHSVTRSSGLSSAPAFIRYASSSASKPENSGTVTVRSDSSAVMAGSSLRLPRSARWARPNAVCPVCGAWVFFYANETGSRVYFDEIGPPWPKHPCTDMASMQMAAALPMRGSVSPVTYPRTVGRRMLTEARRDDIRNMSARDDSSTKHNMTGEAYVACGTTQLDTETVLHLQPIYQKSIVKDWRTPGFVSLELGQVVFVDDGWLTFFLQDRMDVVRIPVFCSHPTVKKSFLRRFRKGPEI